MYVVAIHGLSDDLTANARALADALGITVHEARSLAQVPAGGPAVVGTRPDAPGAEALADQLRGAGFAILVLDTSEADEVGACEVRSFELGSKAFAVATREHESRKLRWDDIDLLVRGIWSARETTRKTVRKRELSLGRAVVTGGLAAHRTKKTEHVSTTTTSDGFVVVYSTSQGPVLLRESGLVYQSLGTAMQPSRAANFAHLCGELRRLAGRSTYDDRLMRTAAQRQILGPTLDTADCLDLAVALVARTRRAMSRAP
jgi:hypothetical protein